MIWRLFWLVCLLGPTIAAADQYVYPYQNANVKPQQIEIDSRYYRWRPLDNEEVSAPEFGGYWEKSRNPSTQGYGDYVDVPPALPREVSRPEPQPHQIMPYRQGYRFRSLSRAEQVRIKDRNKVYLESNQPPQGIRFRPLRDSPGGRESSMRSRNRYQFRPDSQFDREVTQLPPRYPSEPQFNSVAPDYPFRQ
jgi:hypothetical protein